MTKTWVDLLSAGLTPMVAITTVYIAYQQYRVNAERLRLDLYERRLGVLRGVRSHFFAVMRHGIAREQDFNDFVGATAEAQFLFGPEITDFIKEISKRSLNLFFDGLKLHDKDLPLGDERTALAKKVLDELVWYTDQIITIDGLFAKYLEVGCRP